ncbi:MAG TPA: hypothetical protein VMT52_17935 [Planctomycetota bacterium]|nr:hypothetical protein [Planctomycetota bacterium]
MRGALTDPLLTRPFLLLLLASSVAAMPSCAVPRASPREGVIMYHEPVAQVGIMKMKSRPVKQVFMTAGEELAEEHHAFQSFSGPGEGMSEQGRVSEREWNSAVQKMLENSQAGTTRVLKPEAFEDLWSRLVDAGIFTLPVHAGKDRPAKAPHFYLKSGPETWVFARPALQAVRPDDPGVPHIQTWTKVKLVFFDFVNER